MGIHQFITILPKQRASPQDTTLQKLLLLLHQRHTQPILHLAIPILIHYPLGHISQEGDVQLINPSKTPNFFPSCCFPSCAPCTAPWRPSKWLLFCLIPVHQVMQTAASNCPHYSTLPAVSETSKIQKFQPYLHVFLLIIEGTGQNMTL